MQNLVNIWMSLTMARRIVLVGATLAMFLAVLALSRLASSPSLELLYAGLDGRAAGQVVAALEQQGVTYEVRGDSIYVPGGERDALRMTLAGEGLPSAGAAGYELLDGLSGFSTTSQMFDSAYWRAKEGELARTILTSPQVQAARVHIAQGPTGVFQPDVKKTASVTVTTAGGSVDAGQAQAFRHLVAAAVAGLKPEDVEVIDSVGGLVPLPGEANGMGQNAQDRASELRQNIERLLSARVGPGKAVVEVSVDLVTESEQIKERTFDPQGRVAISTDTEETSKSATEPGGDVTVASNLPDGDAGKGGNGQSQASETRERVNYEVSETQREVMRGPGAVRKLSIAVLVDGVAVTGPDGRTSVEPRSDEELSVLRELVGSAAGIDEARGDVLTIKSLAFEPVAEAGTLVEAGLFDNFGLSDVLTLVQVAVLALVALFLGLFVVRPILTRPPVAALPGPDMPLALPGMGSNQGFGSLPALGMASGMGAGMSDAPFMPNAMALDGIIDDGEGGDLPMIMANPDDGEDPSNPMVRLRRLIEERQAESIEILRGWMEQAEERNG